MTKHERIKKYDKEKRIVEVNKKIEELAEKERGKYERSKRTNIEYKIQQGFTRWTSLIIARCRGGFI